ncbi:TniQ protein [Bacillus oleivorans]|uniref:TniQ protein n=1 Tax=Bacillus oleivorans TaxID=1448271 RepID=A0A285D3E2_9BACI|nr:TnsD family Tn7-like transposition protein [Bacillus oleivorans]SNX74330.1 TniQ protein [Bacillus oleivorans]
MFTYFPVIYKDELWHSILARFHARSLNLKESKTLEEIGISGRTKLNPFLPKNMRSFIKKLKYFGISNEEKFLRSHTLFGYYINFLSHHDRGWLYSYMIDGKSYLGTRQSQQYILSNLYYLKYCPKCLELDLKELSDTYLRVSHQYPTVVICPTHKCSLENSHISKDAPSLKLHLSITNIRKLSTKTLFHADNFAQQSLYLSNNDLKLDEKTRSITFYLLFIEKGFVTESGKVDVRKLEKDIISFFGIEFLGLINFNFEIFEIIHNSPLNFHYDLTSVEIFVFINFLSRSLCDFINNKFRLPTGELAPFECLNPFCMHYKKHVINNIQLFKQDTYKEVVFEFTCDKCNVRYEKLFRTKGWQFVRTRKFYNEEWESYIFKCIYEKSYDISRISNKVNINSVKVEEILLKRNKYVTIDESITNNKRNEWIRLVERNKEKSIIELKLMDLPLYAYLKSNDSAWFKSQLNNLSQKVNNSNTDLLRKRDKQVLIYMKEIVKEGIIRRKKNVYYWLSNAVSNLGLHEELPYLENTNKYIDKHRVFLEEVYRKERSMVSYH